MVDPNILSEHILPAWAMLNLRSRPRFGFRVTEKSIPTIDLIDLLQWSAMKKVGKLGK